MINYVIISGLNRQDIILDNCDRNDFLDRLEKNLSFTGGRYYAWVLNCAQAAIVAGRGASGNNKLFYDFWITPRLEKVFMPPSRNELSALKSAVGSLSLKCIFLGSKRWF